MRFFLIVVFLVGGAWRWAGSTAKKSSSRCSHFETKKSCKSAVDSSRRLIVIHLARPEEEGGEERQVGGEDKVVPPPGNLRVSWPLVVHDKVAEI